LPLVQGAAQACDLGDRAGRERGEDLLRFKAGLLPVGEVFLAGAQDVADPIQRVGLAASVAVDLLLDAAADLIDPRRAQFHDVERVDDRDREDTQFEARLTAAAPIRTYLASSALRPATAGFRRNHPLFTY